MLKQFAKRISLPFYFYRINLNYSPIYIVNLKPFYIISIYVAHTQSTVKVSRNGSVASSHRRSVVESVRKTHPTSSLHNTPAGEHNSSQQLQDYSNGYISNDGYLLNTSSMNPRLRPAIGNARIHLYSVLFRCRSMKISLPSYNIDKI